MTIAPERPMAAQFAPVSMAERITLIIDLFDSPFQRLSLEQISRHTGLPRSSAHRILEQLIALSWLIHTKEGYGLGSRATRLIGGSDHTIVRGAAAPHLHELALRTGFVVHLAVLEHRDVLYLDKVGGRGAQAVASRVGGRAPAHTTAVGKAMLAWLPPEVVDATYTQPLTRATPRTLPDLAALHEELYAVRRRRGLAVEHGECVPGVECVAASLRDASGPLAAISLVAPTGSAVERFAPLVVEAVRRASVDLFDGRN